MSKLDKLFSRVFKLSKDLRFDELAKALESIGYASKAPSSGGSHVTFRKPGKMPITIPQGYPINRAYVEMVKNAILDYESEADDE
jgi:predicted RNA binding protein YcfA (HicA-like mRNA interferase family)